MPAKYATVPVAVDAFLVGLSSLALILRFWCRHLSRAGYWWDDWLALAAWPFSVTICLTFLVAGFHGYGHHGGDPTFFLHVLYFNEIWYNTSIALTKLSVLCFYYRIFARSTRFTRALWVTGFFVVACGISFVTASILQCVPVQAYWDPTVKAVCVDKFGFFMGQATPNIVLDFVVLILPLKMVWRLQMRTIQKSALLVVFILGYCNPLISILRLIAFVQLGRKTGEDINYNFIPPALWSAAEVAIAIFSCSVPSLSYLFRRWVDPSRKGSNEKPSYDDANIRLRPSATSSHDLETFEEKSDDTNPRLDEFRATTKSVVVSDSSKGATVSHESSQSANQIHVRRDFDVSVYQPNRVENAATHVEPQTDFGRADYRNDET